MGMLTLTACVPLHLAFQSALLNSSFEFLISRDLKYLSVTLDVWLLCVVYFY